MQKIAAFSMLIALGVAAGPALAGCWPDGWCGSYIPPAFYGCGQRLGLGPGYPGLFPPAFICPPGIENRCMPEQPVIVVQTPPVQVYVAPDDRIVRNETREPERARPAKYNDEVIRARKMYPRGIPGVEYIWSAGDSVVKLK